MVRDILLTKEIDVLVIDLELEGLSVFLRSTLLKKFSKTKIIILVWFSEQIYAQNAIKAGVSGFITKRETRNFRYFYYQSPPRKDNYE
jgi:DNA-binding NarL/FixJ family response regulator